MTQLSRMLIFFCMGCVVLVSSNCARQAINGNAPSINVARLHKAQPGEETVMKLYFSKGACSLAPHIALREANLKFDLESVDLATKKTASGKDFLSINSKGYVPALVREHGTVLTEAQAILQYIADRAKDTTLIPPCGSEERYDVLVWLNFVATEIHKGFGPLFSPDTPSAYRGVVIDNLKKQFAMIDNHLAANTYLHGDNFTVADAYLFTTARWSSYVQLDLTPYKNLTAYLLRIEQRPAVQEALAAEN